ncbi:MAG: hypothetical protein LBM98_05335 [Oscillospiraceae bacterium]|nr:hypothetical protein [Oscillospiraceae bacterium]
MRAAESPRYVPMRPARQSSAGSVTYGICGLRHWIASRLYPRVCWASRRSQ